MCERACFSGSRPRLWSAPGPWRLHRHKTTLLSALIATSESQESRVGWRARLAAQRLWSGVHLGTGQVDWTNTPLSLCSTSELFLSCWASPNSHGQLGHGGLTPEEEPRAVEALGGMPMSCVAAGGWHSVCISGKWLSHKARCCVQREEG